MRALQGLRWDSFRRLQWDFCLRQRQYRYHIIEEIFNPLISLLKTVPDDFICNNAVNMGRKSGTYNISFISCRVADYLYEHAQRIQNADKSMLEMAKSFNFSRWKKFIYIYRPAFMPFLISSCRVALGMCWKSGVMAEVIATQKPSIGREMYVAQQYLQTGNLFRMDGCGNNIKHSFEKYLQKILELLINREVICCEHKNNRFV